MKILSPAKVNLMLRILGRKIDGYHLLQTYFQLLDWGDTMTFKANNSNEIKITGGFGNLAQKDNLIDKAANLLKPYRQIRQGYTIHVEKIIPQGSGLGGGSSNAGTTLRVLNKLWKCELSQNDLLKVAIKLGADVPVFVFDQSAMATGIGEKLTPYEISKHYYVLIFPKTSISTMDVFGEKNLVRNQLPISKEEINIKDNWTNACLSVVLNKFPEVEEMYNKASKYATIYMSGTGSTLFSCFDNKAKAKQFIKQCPSHWGVELCQSKINE